MLCGLTNLVKSQTTDEAPLVVVARSYENKILLRYFPTSSMLLAKANKVGYVIERSVKNDKNIANDKLNFTPLASSPLKKWEEQKWEDAFKKRANVDSNQLKLAGLAMALSMPAEAKQMDVLENDLKSLKEYQTENENKFSYLLLATSGSLFAAEGLGMLAIDDKVTLGTNYVYRVKINSTEANVNNWIYVEVTCQAFISTYLKSKIVTEVFEDDKAINFSFSKNKDYYAYHISRSDDNGKTYKKLNDKLEIKLTPTDFEGDSSNAFLDSNLTNYKTYKYKVFGATIFADEILLAEFEAMPKDRTPPPSPFLKTAKQIKPKEVELIWEMPEPLVKDLKGFMIRRGLSDDSINTTITKSFLPLNARSFVDFGFEKDANNYYKVLAIDTAGNIGYSFPILALLIDSTPPSTPLVKSAIIDSIGKVIITLVPNTEKDFMGYQLLKANAADHEFSVVSQTFNDSAYEKVFVLYDSTTLNTLTKNIYYKVVSFDTHFNQSPDSKIIELKRRDTIPPTAPVITDFKLLDTAITIEFANSSSEDVVQNMLLRRVIGTEKYDTILRNKNASINSFTDINFTSANSYEYSMIAKDEAKLYSQLSTSIIIKPIENKRLLPPVLTAAYTKNSNTTLIRIDINEKLIKKDITAILYCRYAIDDEWEIIKTEKLQNSNSISHQPANGKNEIFYCAVITNEKGSKSIFSKEVKINY